MKYNTYICTEPIKTKYNVRKINQRISKATYRNQVPSQSTKHSDGRWFGTLLQCSPQGRNKKVL